MLNKLMGIYMVVIFLPFVNLFSFFIWAFQTTYCFIITSFKRVAKYLFIALLSMVAMVASWKVISLIYVSITEAFGTSPVSGVIYIYCVGLAIGIVGYISTRIMQKDVKNFLNKMNEEKDL